jgi:hypothetical protein
MALPITIVSLLIGLGPHAPFDGDSAMDGTLPSVKAVNHLAFLVGTNLGLADRTAAL